MDILETRDLCYSYDTGGDALRSVSVAVRQGSVTAVLGGNGAGKSTLFLNLNGVFTPRSGEVYLAGKRVDYTRAGIKELRRRVGIVFQDPNDQLFSASVRDDIAFGAINMGLTDDEVRDRVELAAKQTGAYEFLDKPTHALSFGQKKRAAMAGVLVMRPDVIILDEPTAGLDPSGVSEILALLIDIKNDTGATIIISTHEIDLIPLYCDYAYVLDNGEVRLHGTPDELFSHRAELRSYGLRTPRIRHLMEILNDRDGIPIDLHASTISKARAAVKELYGGTRSFS